MKSYGQFCSVARALDLLGERWTLLIVRELLSGSCRFGEVQRGIPRISRTMLSARFRELVDAGVIDRHEGTAGGPEYRLTPAGLELVRQQVNKSPLSTVRVDGVVPVSMEAVRVEIKGGHLSIRDVLAFRVGAAVELTPHAKAGRGAGAADQIDDHRQTHQRLAPPVGADVGKEPVLNLVPLARPGRQMTDGDRHVRAVGQALQFPFPQPQPGPLLPPASAVMSSERARR